MARRSRSAKQRRATRNEACAAEDPPPVSSEGEPAAAAVRQLQRSATESLTTGCFLFPPSAPDSGADLALPSLGQGEEKSHCAARATAQEAITRWQTSSIERILAEANEEIFDRLAAFCMESTAPPRPGVMQSPFEEVPTALLLTGINTPDHDPIFARLVQRLQEVTPHAVLLRSRECKGVRGLMKSLVQKAMGLQSSSDDDDSLDIKLKRLPNFDFQVLRGWYDHRYNVAAGDNVHHDEPVPKRRKSGAKALPARTTAKSATRPPLVIVLQDFEAFEAKVLADFVTVCSHQRSHLPLFLVLGVASTPDVVHRHLPRSAITLLNMRRFRLRNSTQALETITSEALLSPQCPFKLGPRALAQLLDDFIFHNLSVFHVAKGLRFAALSFCLRNPVSFLCLPDDASENATKMDTLLDASSCRRASAYCSSMKNFKTPTEIVDALGHARNLDQLNSALALCLHQLALALPEGRRGLLSRNLSSWLVECRRHSLAAMPAWAEMQKLMRILDPRSGLDLLQACSDTMEKRHDLLKVTTDFTMAAAELSAATKELRALYLDVARQLAAVLKPSGEGSSSGETQQATEPPLAAGSTDTVTAALRNGAKGKPKVMSAAAKRRAALRSAPGARPGDLMDAIVGDIVRKLFAILEKLSHPMTGIPGYELLYSNEGVADALHGRSRVEIQLALSQPRQTLELEGADLEAEDADPMYGLPDTALAYQLHLEAGRHINLRDWLQAFASVLSGKEHLLSEDNPLDGEPQAAKKSGVERNTPSEIVQARFARAISELQFLGFIKHTGRKADHVARLTWGTV